MHHDDDEAVQRITNAPESIEAAQKHRMKVYGVQMLIRVICLFLAVFIPGPLRWVFIAGAVLLPYSAVLLANAGRDRRETDVLLLDPRLLGSRQSAPSAPSAESPRTERTET